MITDQTDVYIKLFHAKTKLNTTKSLLKEIINTNMIVTDKTNLKIIDELKFTIEEIQDYVSKFQTLED